MIKVLISGGNGLIGQHLCKVLINKGYDVGVLSRQRRQGVNSWINSYYWDISKGEIDIDALRSCDYIIHLAGANIGKKRWTKDRKEKIVKSRIKSTKLLLNSITKIDHRLKGFITASAIGYYGSITSETVHTEDEQASTDFLGSTCNQWERAADKFNDLGVRVVKIRTGIVLSDKDGVLQKLSMSAQLGLGASLGSGRQYMPWIHINDLSNMYVQAIECTEMKGSYNAVAPEHLTNTEFIKKIAKKYNRSVWLPNIPSILIKTMFGEMSAIILQGSRISSERIQATGYKFKFPNIDSALKDLIN